MTLRDTLLRRIAHNGPISVAEYMADALLHPEHGYYMTRDPLGTAGDFTTAPEISQMFGELVGLCLAQAWMDQGAPTPFTLAELGPGRGTLMRDILRATRTVPGFTPDIRLIEASPALKALQATTLQDHEPSWVDGIEDLPDQPLFLVANEFFDALPIRQFQREGPGWREVRIGAQDGGLVRGLAQQQAQPILDDRLEDTRDGDIVEHCPALPEIVRAIATRLDSARGAALIFDYGDWRSLGDTLQALRHHEPVDPLDQPGRADLTAHVDFEALARAAPPARHTRLTPQGVFLERLGITQRAQALAKNLQGAQLDEHIAAHRRLTHPDEMGNLFKVIGLYPASASPPPGLEP